MKTLRNMVTKLLNMGYQIKFYNRADGSLVVTEINGRKFRAKAGNTAVRMFFNESLSESRTRQLERAQEMKQRYKKRGRPKLAEVPKELEKQMQRINRNLSKQKVTHRVTKSGIRYDIEHFGIEKASKKLAQAERYAKGYAYLENIEHLRARLIDDNNKIDSPLLDELISDLEYIIANGGMNFKEEYIGIINNVMYNLESSANAYFNDALDEYDFDEDVTTFYNITKGLLKNAMRENRKKKV